MGQAIIPPMRTFLRACLWIALLLQGCAGIPASLPAPTPTRPVAAIQPTQATPGSIVTLPATAAAPIIQPTAALTQPRLTLAPAGPELQDFQPGVNPLTGLRVQNPALLNLPAVLVSISNMPPTARPQAGTSFAPWVHEMFIGEGTTRFLGVFYGDLPRRIPNDSGGCQLSNPPTPPAVNWIGNRVWLDENQDGLQDPWEAGISAVCVSLLEKPGGKPIATTITNSNGYYAFDASTLHPGSNYTLELTYNPAFTPTLAQVGNDDQDSDFEPLATFRYQGSTDASLDAGLRLVSPAPAQPSPADIAPQRTYVGPIRSGRLTYNDFARMYPAGCLVYASAGDGIRQQLDACEIIFGEQPLVSPNTALLDVDHLQALAQKSLIPGQPVNYSGHLFNPQPPPGGLPGTSLWTYFHAYSQSSWRYDTLSATYLRQTDDGDGLGKFHPDTDRLTGRQLAFENVIVILADYKVFRHGQYDIDLCCGLEGYAFLFRDGQMYKIRWSSNNRAWEQKSGLLRPLHFTGADKLPFPLKPGRTWVSIMTLNSALLDLNAGNWQALFAMPNDLAPQN